MKKWLLLTLCFYLPMSWAAALPEAVVEQLRQVVKLQPGELLYVDFWASWCGPCRKSFPWLNQMQHQYQGQGLKVLAINVDANQADAEAFLTRLPAQFQVLYDPQGEYAQAFALQGMPSSFMLNYQGDILSTHKGFFESQLAQYEQEIQAFLAPH